jgi:ADP-ribose pyrophosphatase
MVYLRSALRPPIALRTNAAIDSGALWELPAGLVEPGESPAEAASRELAEEIGFVVAVRALTQLGPHALPAPGFIAEEHIFFHVEIDPHAPRPEPSEDGSALEHGASIVAVRLEDAIDHCRRGAIRDAKTELAVRRLAEVVS